MITTVQQHILQQQESFPEARGTFSTLLSGITLATKIIQSRVRLAGLNDILGSAGAFNVQGETQQKLDVFANQILLDSLGKRDSVAMLVSEEDEEPKIFARAPDVGKYIVVFDPLDGSSNIDVNVNVGTIFSVFRRPENLEADPATAPLQPGVKQVAAGYVVYGSSTIFVYTAGNGVFGFTLDPAIGAYILYAENMRMPDQGPYYSVNEARMESFPPVYNEYLHRLRNGSYGHEYSSRYIGSLVADFHRTLLKGGVFLYPPTANHPGGKLRLMYEANPLAFIAEQAGGAATSGTQRIMEIQPTQIHQRTPLVIGGKRELDEFRKLAG